MTYKVVIPARLLSSRLPRKPLIMIEGKTLLQRTVEQCLKAVDREDLVVLTDGDEIASHCRSLNIPVAITSTDCMTGTDRIVDYAKHHRFDYYINVQGDEPLMDPMDITRTIEAAQKFEGSVINGYCSIHTDEDYRSRTIPKVVFNRNEKLLYMSRSPIPGNKKDEFKKSYRQVCVYAFPYNQLMEFGKVEKKTTFEGEEDIEILRFLELGYEVQMIELSDKSIAVDTPSDVERVRKVLQELNGNANAK